MLAFRLLIATSLATLLSACVVSPYYPPRQVVYSQPVPAYPQSQPVPVYQDAPGDNGVVVDVAPPAPYVEVVPAIPFAGAIWIGGYWGWGSGGYHWVPGRWDHPHPGYSWRPHVWVQQGGHWHSRGGAWVRG
jgi:hypothetical protein